MTKLRRYYSNRTKTLVTKIFCHESRKYDEIIRKYNTLTEESRRKKSLRIPNSRQHGRPKLYESSKRQLCLSSLAQQTDHQRARKSLLRKPHQIASKISSLCFHKKTKNKKNDEKKRDENLQAAEYPSISPLKNRKKFSFPRQPSIFTPGVLRTPHTPLNLPPLSLSLHLAA